MTRSKDENRIILLDEIRGFAIFCMVFYHGFLAVYEITGLKFANDLFGFFSHVQPIFAGIFIVISGISSRLSRSNLKRGFKLFGISIALSLVTIFLAPVVGLEDCEIYFGILHLLSVCMILFGLLNKLLDKIYPFAGMIVCLVLFILTYGVCTGYLGLSSKIGIELPDALYSTKWLFWLGFPNDNFYSADYFPILPWLFLFFAGTFFGVNIRARMPEFAYKTRVKFFAWIGRRTLIIYLAHMPIICGICMLIMLIIGK